MTHNRYFTIDDYDQPVDVGDIDKLVEWFDADPSRRHLGDTRVGDARVSTVFLGINTNHPFPGPPVLWETMVFGGPLDQYQRRYSTVADARAGHATAVKWAQEATL